ncbi:hypothetical protein Tco_1169976, partial [Tanacetum coccineum]
MCLCGGFLGIGSHRLISLRVAYGYSDHLVSLANANVESANHIFFECDIATDMWKLVFRWGLFMIFPLFKLLHGTSFNDWIISWHASKEKKHK